MRWFKDPPPILVLVLSVILAIAAGEVITMQQILSITERGV